MRVAAVRRLSILAVLAAAAVALALATQGSAAPRAHARTAKFPISQFTCYQGKFAGFKRMKFTISNQFDRLSAAYLIAPLRVCAPAIKNNEPIPDKYSHLVCFSIRVANGPTGTRNAVVTDQFGAHKMIVLVSEPESICLPASKSRTKPGPIPTKLDHYVCYPVKPTSDFATKSVSLRDQFGLGKADEVFRIRTLCAPTSKNKSRVLFRGAVHLLCYDVKSPVKGATVVVREQFGLMKTSLALRDRLCEPALKRLLQ